MSATTTIRQLPLRVTTGGFILNEGLSKLQADDETAKHLHAAAARAYPVFEGMDEHAFTKALALAETALGGALLLPLVRGRLAGLGLVAFAGALLGLYARSPGAHEPHSMRPTRDGVALAKDVWMLGIGLSLMADSRVRRRRRRSRRSG
ncbi:MAG TPA: hypothetical protein VLZ77_08515 [Acidimicrobiales bacterium]|nr:hypothetical protein [Acidimicrobiales bacterium]